jgi:hypothetical protein
MRGRRSSCLCVAAAIVATATPCFAQASDNSEKPLLEAENPIATRVSVPFQSNTYFSSGPLKKTGNVVIVQPVVPIA